MRSYTCANCSVVFERDQGSTFCSFACYNLFRKGRQPKGGFQKGNDPWNRGVKGIHLSPETQFKPGPRPHLQDPIGTVRIRTRHKRGGDQRAWVKVLHRGHSSDWRLRAVLVWERANGPVPRGYIVHHEDRNTLNDTLENLSIITRAEHLTEHRPEFEETRKKRLAEALAERARARIAAVSPMFAREA